MQKRDPALKDMRWTLLKDSRRLNVAARAPEGDFENEWQRFRTRQYRALELMTAPHTYERPRRYTVAVKAIDIFGNDTMTLMPVNVG